MTVDLTQAILDWVNTNANGPTATYYAMQQPSYQCKCEPFETVDELRLLYGADMDTLVGEDANRNGILDPNENDDNQNGMLDPGILEYVTVYSREPNTNSDGSAKVNISTLTSGQAQMLLTNLSTSRANEIMINLGLGSIGPSAATARGASTTSSRSTSGSTTGTTTARAATASFTSPLQFYDKSQMTMTEFALIGTNLTTTSGTYVDGRVNVNTASAAVLTCLLRGDTAAAQQLVSYRQSNPNNLTSIAWVIDALGQSYPDDARGPRGRGLYHDTQLPVHRRHRRRRPLRPRLSAGEIRLRHQQRHAQDRVSPGSDPSRVGSGQRGAPEPRC